MPKPPMPPVHINFIGEIVTKTAEAVMALISDVVNNGHPAIYLGLSSPGGNIADGIALYNFLRALPVKVTTHNIGSVNSIGNVVFLAGEQRLACAHTTFMFHGVSLQSHAFQVYERQALKGHLAEVEHDEKRISDIVAARTRLTRDAIEGFLLGPTTLSAEDALGGKIVHKIDQMNIPKGCPVFYPGHASRRASRPFTKLEA